jgi:hypothetical protein
MAELDLACIGIKEKEKDLACIPSTTILNLLRVR